MGEKSNSFLVTTVFILFLASIAYNIYLFSENTTLSHYYEQCISDLEKIKYEYENLTYQYLNLQNQYIMLYENITLINQSLYAYEQEVSDALQWFKYNSELKNSGIEESKLSILFNRCVRIEKDKCYINLGCIEHMNSQEYIFGFDYKYDNETTTKEDKLLSLEEFVENEGGDCEDYALFYKAEFNYLKQLCYEKGADELVLLSFSFDVPQHLGEKAQDFFLENTQTWYYPNVYVWKLSNYTYAYVVCGNIYDFNAHQYTGHCMVAFTPEKINYPSQLQQQNAVVVEPQIGSVYGIIGKDINITTNPYLQNDSIYYVITDEDQYIYSLYFEKWLSYKQIQNILEEMKLKINHLSAKYKPTAF
ncbi:MAG: hypothetical protein GXN99_03380 [Candidatus Nanohaloarchaeota archaeon]|nr:hypothetical protein [Candidatus Nanohaloarchaeota archaeon]